MECLQAPTSPPPHLWRSGGALGVALFLACSPPPSPVGAAASTVSEEAATAQQAGPHDVQDATAEADADPDVSVSPDRAPILAPAPPHQAQSVEELWALTGLPALPESPTDPRTLLAHRLFSMTGPSGGNQGNAALARHTKSQAECLQGLAQNGPLQTPEQRNFCGAENMVPIHKRGEASRTCIDIFEFPNRACELPVVWMAPVFAEQMCKLQGKRLCTQDEWQVACHGSPEDEPDRDYAYGDTLDLTACHTQTPHRPVVRGDAKAAPTASAQPVACSVSTSGDAYQTCATDTEPSGAFPRCRSRFGVYDLHGNVAEVMTRRDPEKGVVTQLKGSAWFYSEVAQEKGRPHMKPRETYPDHCDFDPRWHVEKLSHGYHVNYHLGFRCCKTANSE